MYVDYSGESLILGGLGVLIYSLGAVSVATIGTLLIYDATHDQVLSKVAIGLVSDVCDAVSSVASAI